MKKITTVFISLLAAVSLFAQSAESALLFSQEEYEGTARTVAMGGAFTALGGDLGAISINPASSGVFRHSEFAFTPSISFNNSVSEYLGETSKERFNKLSLSNMGYVSSFDTDQYSGLLNFNFGIVYNKKNNFNSTMSAFGSNGNSSYLGSLAGSMYGHHYSELEGNDGFNPYFNGYAPWAGILAYDLYLLDLDGDSDDAYIGATENRDGDQLYTGGYTDQDYFNRSYGSTEEYALNFGGNISDQFYFGVNLNLLSVAYSFEEAYSEYAQNVEDFQSGWEGMAQSYFCNTNGAGINMKLGVIYNPLPGVRFGATWTTPTLYSLTDTWGYSMSAIFNPKYADENHISRMGETPQGIYDYEVKAPMRWSIGAAYTFLDKALISAEVEGVNYSRMAMRDYNGNPNEFSAENSQIRKEFSNSAVVRLGGEFWLTDQFSVRGGFTKYAAPGSNYVGRSFYSGGIGWRINRAVSLDIAYQSRVKLDETFALYNSYEGIDAPTGVKTAGRSKLLFTLGFKF